MSGVERLALQVLLPSFPGPDLPPEWAGLLAEGLAGICLFGSNLGDPDADAGHRLTELTSVIRAAHPGALIATDEEGGDVTRLHAMTGSPVPGPAVLGALDDVVLTEAVGAAVGRELRRVGIDLDLAPVADVNSNPDNPVIGSRSFGSDPALAARHVAAWVRGLEDTGVAACVKHFPGHGDTGEDSHLALPTLDVDLATLQRRELVPFAAAVAAGASTVMTSHIVLPALDRELPGTLSAPVLELLRRGAGTPAGFEGVIVSDALDMAGASAGRGIPEAAVLSLTAGADLLCIGPDKSHTLVREIQAAVVEAVAAGRLPLARLQDAAARVSRLAARLSAGRGDVPGGCAELPDLPDLPGLVAAVRRALVVQGGLPALAGARVVSLETEANIAVGEVPWGLTPDLSLAPDQVLSGWTEWPEWPEWPEAERPLILQVRDAHRRADVLAVLAQVAAAGAPAVVIEWGWPGPYDGPLPRICTRGHSRPGVAAVSELLREAGWDR